MDIINDLGKIIINRKSLKPSLEWFNGKGFTAKCCNIKACLADCCRQIVTLTGDECEEHIGGFYYDNRFGRYCLKRKDDDETCYILSDKNKCSNYENRPLVCKVYPLGLTFNFYEDSDFFIYTINTFENCGAALLELNSPSLDNDLMQLAVSRTKDLIRREEIKTF